MFLVCLIVSCASVPIEIELKTKDSIGEVWVKYKSQEILLNEYPYSSKPMHDWALSTVGGNLHIFIWRNAADEANTKWVKVTVYDDGKKIVEEVGKDVPVKTGFSPDRPLYFGMISISFEKKIENTLTVYVIDNYNKKTYKFTIEP